MSDFELQQSAFGEPCIYPGCSYLAYRSAVHVHLEVPPDFRAPTGEQHVTLEGGLCDLHAPMFLKHLKRAIGTKWLERTPIRSL